MTGRKASPGILSGMRQFAVKLWQLLRALQKLRNSMNGKTRP
ncbi:hypothetical protein [Escherichia coli]|nr:hypothetical protein [Escherichia coli]